MKKSILAIAIFLLAAISGTLPVRAQLSAVQNRGESLVSFNDGQKSYQLKLSNDKLVALSVNGKKIVPAEFSKYDSIVNRIRMQIRKDKLMAERDSKQAQKEKTNAEKEMEQAEKDKISAEADAARELSEVKEKARDESEADEDRIALQEEIEQANEDRLEAERDMEEARIEAIAAEKEAIEVKTDARKAEEDKKMLDAMIASLVKDRVAASKEALTEILVTKEEMSVNGETQSADIQKKYSSRFLLNGTTSIHYKHKDGERNFSVEKDYEKEE